MRTGRRWPRDERRARAALIRVWRGNGLSRKTIGLYLQWVRRFEADCAQRGVAPETALQCEVVSAFARRYAAARRIDRDATVAAARGALRTWAVGLQALGRPVPLWTPPTPRAPLPPILDAFLEFRRRHRGVAASAERHEVHDVHRFLRWLTDRRRPLARLTLVDLDAFIAALRGTLRPKTVAGVCSRLRAFLRFLHASGRHPRDLAPAVLAPRVRADAQLPRALPWPDVRRVLHAIPRTTPRGRRDYALLLVMATYGLGAAEVRSLQLADLDWRAGTLRLVRPKTGVATLLPLLAPVARTLAGYLRHGRPQYTAARTVFVSWRAPYAPLGTASAVRHVLHKHARAAGIRAAFLGSHALRHSHACRQIELGVAPKVLSDILGHRRPASTSAYVRIAVARLRALALPVP